MVWRAHSNRENWIGDIRFSNTRVTAAAMSLGVAFRAPSKVANCLSKGVTDTKPVVSCEAAMLELLESLANIGLIEW